MNPNDIDWSIQHCGVHRADRANLLQLMPDLKELIDTFPDTAADFSWDVKVHLLMPRQYPCIPNWRADNVPRVDGIQRFDQCRPDLPMYLWISGAPLTQFAHGYAAPRVWHRFTQMDQHRGSPASEFGWRGFIRATHRGIMDVHKDVRLMHRRHTQVYLDADSYQW